MRFRRVIGMFALAVVSVSCSLGSPADAGSLNVYLDVEKATLPVGDSMTIAVIARNVGYEPITLSGPSDCLLNLEVLDSRGTVVWHTYGECVGAVVTEALAVGQDKVQTFRWTGINLAGARLPSGTYGVRGIARLAGESFFGQVHAVAVE